jgi:hypothetical protein
MDCVDDMGLYGEGNNDDAKDVDGSMSTEYSVRTAQLHRKVKYLVYYLMVPNQSPSTPYSEASTYLVFRPAHYGVHKYTLYRSYK